MNRALGALLLVTLSAAALPARADTASEVRYFDERARKAYEKGRYQEALVSFLLADELAPSARSLYNVGLCAELAGEDALAFAYFGTYLAGADADGARRMDATARAARLQERLAVIHVVTDPPGATIVVDRAELGDFGRTPRSVPVAAGERTVLVTLDGHQPARITVPAAVGVVRTVELRLEPILGVVEVELDPPGATLALLGPGAPRALTPVSGRLGLPVGRHRLRASAPGHQPVEAEVLVRAEAPTSLALAPPRLPAPAGSLLVSSGAVPARLYVDGKAWAMTPARVERLPVGTHTVELRAPGRRPWRGRVKVERDRTAFVSVTLRRAGPTHTGP